MFLIDVCEGRDNNLNLIRMLAAGAVLVSHAWPISLGPGTSEPLRETLGYSLGTLALFTFFVISGFLIAQSFERQPTLMAWMRARVLRLFPALLVVLLLTAGLMGPLVTALPLGRYFADPETLSYVPRNLSLARLQYYLPGVFADNPYPTAINGSLWTLFYEVLCYGGIMVIGLAGAFRHRRRMALAFGLFAIAWLSESLMPPDRVPHHVHRFFDLGLPFAVGTAFYVLRRHVPLHPGLLVGLIAATALVRGMVLYDLLLVVTLAYGVFLTAYRVNGAVRQYNRLGDYSYGTYIYAFPMQQLMSHLFGPMLPLQNIALAVPATLLFAVLSWHWIERPALALARTPTPRETAATFPLSGRGHG